MPPLYDVRRLADRGPRWWIVDTATGRPKMGPFDSFDRAAGICAGPLYNGSPEARAFLALWNAAPDLADVLGE